MIGMEYCMNRKQKFIPMIITILLMNTYSSKYNVEQQSYIGTPNYTERTENWYHISYAYSVYYIRLVGSLSCIMRCNIPIITLENTVYGAYSDSLYTNTYLPLLIISNTDKNHQCWRLLARERSPVPIDRRRLLYKLLFLSMVNSPLSHWLSLQLPPLICTSANCRCHPLSHPCRHQRSIIISRCNSNSSSSSSRCFVGEDLGRFETRT